MPTDDAQTAQRKEEMRQQWTDRASLFRERGTAMLQPATDLLLAALHIRPNMRILDVASGPGEPAITLAAAIAPDGHVTATDLVPEMLTVAAEKAEKRGVINITFQQADAEALPFPDATFDAVTCRFGVMLFADVQQGLREMRRVLKPGGQLVCIVWGPRDRDPMTRSLAVVRRFIELPPPPPPDTPNRFRFSEPGAIAEQLRMAGFRQVEDTLHMVPMQWQGSAEQWWETVRKLNPAMQAAIDALDANRQAELTQAALDARRAQQAQPDGAMAAVIVASAVR